MNYEPMLPANQYKPFDDPAFLFEPMVDGRRLLLVYQKGKARLFTRYGHDITHRYPELARVPADEDVILDGEIACIDRESGHPDFNLTRERGRLNNQAQIEYARDHFPVRYFLFDILQRGEQDLRKLPLVERKKHLHETITDNDFFCKMKYVDGYGTALFEAAAESSVEGIVAKRKDSLYTAGESSDWRQIVCYRTEEVYVTGYCKRGSGWLVGVPNANGKIRPAGIVGTDIMTSERSFFLQQARERYAGEDHQFVYLKPGIEAKLTFRGWTREGRVRDAVFMERAGAENDGDPVTIKIS